MHHDILFNVEIAVSVNNENKKRKDKQTTTGSYHK